MMNYLISPDLSLKENVCQFSDTYHCIHTKEHSLKLAHRFGVDPQKCYQAALLHDISAVISHNQMMEIALQNAWTIDPSEKSIHSCCIKEFLHYLHKTSFKLKIKRFYQLSHVIRHSKLILVK